MLLLLAGLPWLCAAEIAPTPPPRYALLITGGELLEGAYADSHTLFLTRSLRPLGLECTRVCLVDDNADALQATLRFLTNSAELVIVTGGLGPTVNDITREALAGFAGIRLVESPEVLEQLERRFGQSRDQLRPNIRRQALVPEGGRHLANLHGTAVGLVFEARPAVIVALPGPPRELQPMATDQLVPYLRERFGLRPPGATVTLRFVGAGQSLIDQTLRDKALVPPDVKVWSQFEGGRVDFTFALPGDTDADRRRLRQLDDAIRAELPAYFYADDGSTLEQAVARHLERRQARLALAEVATGGTLSAALTAVPGFDRCYAGSRIAASEEELRRTLGIADVAWSAAGSPADRVRVLTAALQGQSTNVWSVVVGASANDPQGTRVWLGIAAPGNHPKVEGLPLRGGPEIGRANLTTSIVDALRRALAD